MSNQLRILSTDDTESPYISANGVIVNLGDNRYNTVVVDNRDQSNRPVRESELYNKLLERNWNLPERLQINTEGGIVSLGFTVTATKNLDFIDENRDYVQTDFSGETIHYAPREEDFLRDKTYSVINNSGINIDYTPDESDLSNFNNTYKDIINMLNSEDNIYLFNTSKYSVDILSDSVTFDVVSRNSYTNTVSLENLYNYSSNPNVTAKVDVSVRYSKNNVVYTHDLTFEAFEKDSGIKNNIIDSSNDDIILEYLENVIRVIPGNNDVDECIISNCTVTYGNI